jgi:hypothetical protein
LRLCLECGFDETADEIELDLAGDGSAAQARTVMEHRNTLSTRRMTHEEVRRIRVIVEEAAERVLADQVHNWPLSSHRITEVAAEIAARVARQFAGII